MIEAALHPTSASSPAELLVGLVDMLDHAEQLFSVGRVVDARARLEELAGITQHASRLHAQVLSDLAVIAARDGNRGEAVELAREALRQVPDHGPALEVLGHCREAPAQAAAALARKLQTARIEEFKRLWTCRNVTGTADLEQPLLLAGRGRITFGEGVRFGWPESPGFHDQYAYVEAAHEHTHVQIGDRTTFNNGATLRAEGPGIAIGADCLFGWSVQVLDSDFHELHPQRRHGGTPVTKHVRIGNNVFIGANSIVMKGVSIGDDTVVGAGSVVLHALPAGVVAGGNPARVIRPLES